MVHDECCYSVTSIQVMTTADAWEFPSVCVQVHSQILNCTEQRALCFLHQPHRSDKVIAWNVLVKSG